MVSDAAKQRKLLINIIPADFDLAVLERDTLNLRDELNEIRTIDKVELAAKQGQLPEGAKPGGELIEWGSLLVTLAATAAPSLGKMFHSWLSRHDKSKIEIVIDGKKIVINGASDIEKSKALDAWISSVLQK